MVKSRSGVVDDTARSMRDHVSEMFGGGLLRDGEIWKVKRPAIHIMQLPSDGPFRQSRTWYSQFHNPRAQAEDILRGIAEVQYAKGWPPFTPQSQAVDA